MEKIKIEKNEELGSVLAKLESSGENDIVFSIAEGAIMLQSVINLKILKKRAEELGKSVAIERSKEEAVVTSVQAAAPEPKVQKSVPGSVDVRVEKNAPAVAEKNEGDFRKQDKKMEVSNSVGRVKMFDIVKKYDAPAPASRPQTPSSVYEKKKKKGLWRKEIILRWQGMLLSLPRRFSRQAPFGRRRSQIKRRSEFPRSCQRSSIFLFS